MSIHYVNITKDQLLNEYKEFTTLQLSIVFQVC